ncbi:hypothetical protein FRC11_004152 [Ceratobasidium sp. 423]|nr:hypothetical protein FRC11_004152 [Ceratobasidium sp. 423]
MSFFKRRNKDPNQVDLEEADGPHSPPKPLPTSGSEPNIDRSSQLNEEETVHGSVSDKKSKKWARLGDSIKSMGNKIEFGSVKEAMLGIKDILERVEGVANSQEEYEMLLNELKGLSEVICDYLDSSLPLKLTASMKNIGDSIKDEMAMVQSKLNRGKPERFFAKAEVDIDDVLQHYRKLEGHVRRLFLNAGFSTVTLLQEHIEACHHSNLTFPIPAITYTFQETRSDRTAWSARFQEYTTETRSDRISSLLDRLNPARSARYDSAQASELNRRRCTPGTRVEVIKDMLKWAHDQRTQSVYWTNGMAGTGKTTISYSLCTELESSNLLAASFFCTRSLLDCKTVSRIIPSIAYQIAEFSDPYCYELFQILQTNRDIADRVLETQFEALIAKPLLHPHVQETLPEMMVVVIDALDECENKESTGKILRLLLSDEYNLPIKFFIFSRPEVQIRQQMADQKNIQTDRLVLHELNKTIVQSDIRTYLGAEFSDLKRQLDESLINELDQHIDILVQRSGELFIYAATAVRYIGHENFTRDPLRRFQQVLKAGSNKPTPHRDLDKLYSMVLKQAFDDPGLGPEDKEVMKLVLDTVICAQEPITTGALAGILQLENPGRARSALQPLWSVLHVMEKSELVATFHASFPDFMLDRDRSGDYYCRATQHHDLLAESCFRSIRQTTPGFNICGLESSFESDDEIPDLAVRVRDAIPSLLFYSCRYWSAHLSLSSRSPNLIKDLEVFLSCHLLLWMEVLNLKKVMGIGFDIIQRAVGCCPVGLKGTPLAV